MPALTARDVQFLTLQGTVLCVECELISYNNTGRCLFCGSQAVLNVSRVLGGSLKENQSGVFQPEFLHRIVAEALMMPVFAESPASTHRPEVRIAAAMRRVVDQACTLTGAEGAALAVYQDDGEITCTARAGRAAPEVGAQVQVDSGISGLCVRTGRTLRCDNAERDSQVDAECCRELGVRSIVAAPLVHLDAVIGILEVLSSKVCAFDDEHAATVQLLAGLMVYAFMHKSASENPALLESRPVLQFPRAAASSF